MTATSKQAAPGTEPDRLPRVLRALAVVERLGNALPHPFWLFWILAAILGVTSAGLAAAGVSVVSPADGETVVVQNLLSGAGLAMAVSTAVDNFATFGPMGTIVVVIMGVAIAERTGFLSAAMKVSVSRVPVSWVVFAVAFKYGRPPMEIAHEGGIFITRRLADDSGDAQTLLECNRRLQAGFGLMRGVSHT